jgi:hypothetical protein
VDKLSRKRKGSDGGSGEAFWPRVLHRVFVLQGLSGVKKSLTKASPFFAAQQRAFSNRTTQVKTNKVRGKTV